MDARRDALELRQNGKLMSRRAHARLALVALAFGLGGCPAPYALSYHPLLDPADPTLVPGERIEHRWVEDMDAASQEMYRAGYVMVGYSDMFGTHVPAVAPPAASNWGRSLDAAVVLQSNHGQRYLATYWRLARSFVFGAYYDDPPEEARRVVGADEGVIVLEVVAGSPAAAAFLTPGDLLLRLDGEVIADARWLDAELARPAGGWVVFTLWPLRGKGPLLVPVELTAPLAAR
jgi:hypothetical protein